MSFINPGGFDSSPSLSPAPATMTVAGMSLRDYFAGQALASMVTELVMPPSASEPEWAETSASNAYELADAMLAARDRDRR